MFNKSVLYTESLNALRELKSTYLMLTTDHSRKSQRHAYDILNAIKKVNRVNTAMLHTPELHTKNLSGRFSPKKTTSAKQTHIFSSLNCTLKILISYNAKLQHISLQHVTRFEPITTAHFDHRYNKTY